ncbi:hypothetical protein EDD15DRAFT_2273534, partial [Pisolithus albus]
MFLFSYLYSVFLLSVWTSFGLCKLDSYLPCTVHTWKKKKPHYQRRKTEIQARRLRIITSSSPDSLQTLSQVSFG